MVKLADKIKVMFVEPMGVNANVYSSFMKIPLLGPMMFLYIMKI
jgi:hypothetical protein